MKIKRTSTRSDAGYNLIECMAYCLVLLLLLGTAYKVFYGCVENSFQTRRSAEDIAAALQAGERWRADLRAVGNETISRAATETGDILRLPGKDGPVDYTFVSNSVVRRVAEGPWRTVLTSVNASIMTPEARGELVAWRWDVELKPRSRKPASMRPLFTFLAVPEKEVSP